MIIELPISKSIANRLLILGRDAIHGIPADALPHDVFLLKRALETYQPRPADTLTIDVEDCGTAMRFLTAYFALIPSDIILTGTERMCRRPIGPIVDALRQLGAEIEYEGQEGFPPLHIHGKIISGGEVSIRGNVSSQFISALLLASHLTKHGIKVKMLPPIVSSPYISLTQAIIDSPDSLLEPDWSAAAFWYEYAAICGKEKIYIRGLKTDSLQGDRIVAKLFEQLGVKTDFVADGIVLSRNGLVVNQLQWDFTDCPDLYPAVVATCYALGIATRFIGVETLRYKESDRIEEMQRALANLQQPITSDDHRIVMALAMLRFANLPNADRLTFQNPDCVAKSYPTFWKQIQKL